ncbi:hypothetical protein DICPUDRAFT_156735 [Dictyostelium purpureum]|uniref:Uncharacterized protein n=1 Tax=Dictyostelium purpureum TaxID=5786 RepID=F0ZXA8_DICPU|nr:uncharacterized protein DICPUDRAFT_156735 [Dictyostelium purpureum]EGC31423.1 hypothetical protein DICPUDRAFT_156735 [Dictyostelium purpureum]|eukprot:XP_003292056.1 hypothetical protein DICPUDRAFT_156735 [Dictyostelium purpureum]
MSSTAIKVIDEKEIARLMAITQGTPEYFSERKKSPACGSDLAAMIGVNPIKPL